LRASSQCFAPRFCPRCSDGGRALSVARRATVGYDQILLGEWFAPLNRQTPQQVLYERLILSALPHALPLSGNVYCWRTGFVGLARMDGELGTSNPFLVSKVCSPAAKTNTCCKFIYELILRTLPHLCPWVGTFIVGGLQWVLHKGQRVGTSNPSWRRGFSPSFEDEDFAGSTWESRL
jgi:hypothetical protein